PFVDFTGDAVDRTNGVNGGALYIFANSAAQGPGRWWGKTGVLEPGEFGLYHGVVLTSKDGGSSFSELARARPAEFSLGEAFAAGSTVLADGTPIAAYETVHVRHVKSGNQLESHNAIDVMVARDQGKVLELRATVRDARSLYVWPSTIVQDESHGRNR